MVRKSLLPVIAIVLAWPGCASAQGNTIAERLAAEIRVALPGATVVVPDPYGLEISYAGQTRFVGIGSVHTACGQGAAHCDAAIHGYAQRAASFLLETTPLLRDQLRIVVRTRGYLDRMRGQMGSPGNFVSEHLVGELVNVCYRNLPQGRRPIVTSDLTGLQLDQPMALSACKSNSHASLAPLASLLNTLPDQGIGVIRNGDDVTGYLSAPEDWRTLAEQLGGLIVAAPSVETVLYARGSNVIEVDALAALAAQMHAEAPVPVSTQVLRWTDRGWVAVQR
jgi:hypothetical protein